MIPDIILIYVCSDCRSNIIDNIIIHILYTYMYILLRIEYARERSFHFGGAVLSTHYIFFCGLKQGDALSLLLFNFSLEYAIKRVQEN